MSARQPFRPTPRPDSQLSSSQSDSKVFHSQRIDTDLGNAANKSFNLSGLFTQKKRDQSLPSRKSKSRDDHQVPSQSIPSNHWSTGSHTSRLDLSPAPSPILSSAALGLSSTYQSSGMPSAQVEDAPSSPVMDNGSATGSFFAQDADSQHMLSMINEVDEDTEMINDSTSGSPSVLFTGRYTDVSSSGKRTQRVDEDVDNMENVNPKRFKSDQQGSGSTIRSRPASSYTHAAPPEQLRTNQHGLDTLMGFDSDAYINENLKKYEELKEKWANSSVEEWKAGGDEIANRFSEILDMVKDHMMQKMTLYADIQVKIDEHKNVLEERSKDLTEAKRDLVKRSGNAIGQED
ncbi:hypothetical protein BJ322DRAFT_1206981 [Thelephora terrestris]|uniref:Extracellular mutant protein 11 C-terminal domain-containing protein n=1 Tax=Thelephora terrestris TaxID=56493 RepID=A0A9P6HQE0_9AGAM|nr:hypothetical protein BJ322DRAFT_1206981 [Thelephora terrestris]